MAIPLGQKTCPKPKGCGRRFVPRRGTNRIYCFECKPERFKSGPESMSEPAASAAVPLRAGDTAAAVEAELERIGQAKSVAGTVALRLARSLDDPDLGAAQVSSISAQLLRTIEPLQERGPREPDVIDGFSQRLLLKLESA